VYAGEIVEHLAHPHDALAQWIRLLRPGGRLVVTTPNRRHLMARLLHREVVQNPEHLFEWSRDELLDAVRAAGGRILHVEGLHLPVPVPVPGMGWRDVIAGVNRRIPVPPMVARAGMELGRHAPRFAMNVAVVAEPA
jgi:SAM-dependent methyltransferase